MMLFYYCEENALPHPATKLQTDGIASRIAIINMPTAEVSAIFLIFACKDNANRAKCKIKASKTNFYFQFRGEAYHMKRQAER